LTGNGSKIEMGLTSWDDVEDGQRKQRNRNMWKTVTKRKRIDEYDTEYDKGKTKKVKDKSKSSSNLTSAAFDAVARSLRSAKKGVQKVLGKRRGKST